ncbi:MAG: glycosyltransferase family 4 protein [Candidatus Parcubacteria bacterium]|nr:glycosyltransferase family 4 protein [Candidatus Parcubacteria bacterium]
MKICLYLEFYHFLGGIFFKNTGTGLLSSYENQKKTLRSLGIEFTEKWDDSCDILQINTPWLKSLWLMKKVRRLGKKIIIWSHVTAEDMKGVFWFGSLVSPLLKIYYTYVYGLADVVFCPSVYTKSLLVAYGLPEEKLVAQSNGVDLKFFFKDEQKRAAYRTQYNCKGLVVGTVGLVIPRKGTDTFLELAKKYPRHQFIWFGKIYSKLLAKPLPKILPDNVKFTGYVDDICAAFNALDIFIFPSYEENQGMVILEAAAVGLPILVRDIPVYRDWLKHGENCLKAKNNEEFKICLDRLINDQNLKNRLSEGAKILAQKESIDFLNKNLFLTYQRLLSA